MKRVKKLYQNDPRIPVPRQTLFWKASLAKRCTDHKEERNPLSPTTGKANEDMLAGMETSDQGLKSDNSEEEASISHLHEHELKEELENISNGGSSFKFINLQYNSARI